MKTIKAREYRGEYSDEVVTDGVLASAIAAGHQRRATQLHAKGVRYLPDFKALAVSFEDQTAVLLPVERYEELAGLSVSELERIEVGYGGSALCLAERDLHVSIAGLVSASKPLMELAATVIAARNGRRTSAAKALAARENGRKGGRPRKLAGAG
ncbi:hypothetical protein PIGHUM_02029 [Pigmentiphaga humi]|uniref:DUF2442 domain-containing protein n=1 Tax=Pigmentiphaga humi TaxID=2478468 RepID=A0A3P4B0Y6_9BURK|nr:DUF2442 domain-containing protein [Pigmentiphaga humi]VCU69963.1 hypothetical protein PIGHUM_02029 [Pigmentiphaga humi]